MQYTDFVEKHQAKDFEKMTVLSVRPQQVMERKRVLFSRYEEWKGTKNGKEGKCREQQHRLNT